MLIHLNLELNDYVKMVNYENCPLTQLRKVAGKAKRPQSYGIQDEGRLTHFYFLCCLHDGLQFTV